MIPPTPSTRSVAPIRSGATSWTLRAKNDRFSALPRRGAAAAVYVATSSPLDQYLVNHPEYFLGRDPEQELEALVGINVKPFVAHETRAFRRASSRALSAARARCRCVFTVPSGIPSASATS